MNTPLSLERIVGGESQADGVELSYLFSTPFFLRGTIGGYNKLGAENERIDQTKSRAWSRFTYLGRLQSYFDIHDNHSVELGTSLAFTPSIRIPADPHGGNRTLTGIDLTYRYQPLGSTLYQGLTIGTEFFGNSERVERASGFRRMFAPVAMPTAKRRSTASGRPDSFMITRRASPVRERRPMAIRHF